MILFCLEILYCLGIENKMKIKFSPEIIYTLIGLVLVLLLICGLMGDQKSEDKYLMVGGGNDSGSGPTTSTAPPVSDEIGKFVANLGQPQNPSQPTTQTPSTPPTSASPPSTSTSHSPPPDNLTCQEPIETSRCPVPRAGVPSDSVASTTKYLRNSCRDDIHNPQYPVADIPTKDVKQNLIDGQRRLIREYQSYIKNLRGQCCRRLYSGQNLLDNPLSNKNWEVRPMIADGGDNALYLMSDDFSNVMNVSPNDAEKFRVSFYDQEPAPPRTYALQASQNWPMYHRTFDRSFVSRIPDPPNSPFKVEPFMDFPSDFSRCGASRACEGTFSPPWSTNSAYTCQGMHFDKPRAPEPQGMPCSLRGAPPPYIPPENPPPEQNTTQSVPTTPAAELVNSL